MARGSLEVAAAGGADAAVLADEQLRDEIAAAATAWRLQLEKAEYKVRRAERQYTALEPEHRTVARELERRWNQRLEELETVRANAAAALEPRRPLTETERERAQQLGRHLEEVWGANTTMPRDQKRLLRCPTASEPSGPDQGAIANPRA